LKLGKQKAEIGVSDRWSADFSRRGLNRKGAKGAEGRERRGETYGVWSADFSRRGLNRGGAKEEKRKRRGSFSRKKAQKNRKKDEF
jgi:hypothetical protein